MEVAARTDRFRQHYSGCIDSLEDLEDVASSGDFFDKDRCETFVPKLLMDAQEVDLGAMKDLRSYAEFDWNAGYERYQLL